ncbi:hypothetical protein Tco_0902203 [Tanacetum coccineum]
MSEGQTLGEIFWIIPLIEQRKYRIGTKGTEEDHSLSHPPGFTPEEGLNEVIPLVTREGLSYDSEVVYAPQELKKSVCYGIIWLMIESMGCWKLDGFDKLDRGFLERAPVNKKMPSKLNFMGKLKILKEPYSSWLSIHKVEFARFDKPSVESSVVLNTPFSCSLSIDQKEDMELMISKEEVKRAVWDCGV